MWNLKIDFGTIFWDILTLHPHNSKPSLSTTGTFGYVESQMSYRFGYKEDTYVDISCRNWKPHVKWLLILQSYVTLFTWQNKVQKELHTIIWDIVKSIFPTTDSFCLIRSHMWCDLGEPVGSQTCDIFSFLSDWSPH